MNKPFAYLISAALLSACAGPTSPLGGVNPWNLESRKGEEAAIAPTIVSKQKTWEERLAEKDPKKPWILIDPQNIDYVAPMTIKIRVHHPEGLNVRPRVRLVYNNLNLSSKIRRSSYWTRISPTDWEFSSTRMKHKFKFTPSRTAEFKVQWNHVAAKLQEPFCNMENASEKIQQTGKFQADAQMRIMIDALAQQEKLNPNLVAGLIAQESGFNPKAVSSSKALGLTQITPIAESKILEKHPGFPRFPGLNNYDFLYLWAVVNTDKIRPEQEWRLNPELSIQGGMTYLRQVEQYWNQFDASKRAPASFHKLSDQEKLRLYLASYNSGPYRVKQAYLQNHRHWLADDSLNEARTYTHKVASYCSKFGESQRENP